MLLSLQYVSHILSETCWKYEEIILYEKQSKGDVDYLDKRVGTHCVKYRSNRWHLRISCNTTEFLWYKAFTILYWHYNYNQNHRRMLLLFDLDLTLSRHCSENYRRHPHKIREFFLGYPLYLRYWKDINKSVNCVFNFYIRSYRYSLYYILHDEIKFYILVLVSYCIFTTMRY